MLSIVVGRRRVLLYVCLSCQALFVCPNPEAHRDISNRDSLRAEHRNAGQSSGAVITRCFRLPSSPLLPAFCRDFFVRSRGDCVCGTRCCAQMHKSQQTSVVRSVRVYTTLNGAIDSSLGAGAKMQSQCKYVVATHVVVHATSHHKACNMAHGLTTYSRDTRVVHDHASITRRSVVSSSHSLHYAWLVALHLHDNAFI